MPITVRWADVEQSIIVYDYLGSWTWDDLYNAIRTVEEWTNDKQRVVPIIHNLTNGRMIPKDALFHSQRLVGQLPEGAVAVVVGAGTFARIIIETLRHLNRGFDEQYKTANTLEEAVELLKQLRQ